MAREKKISKLAHAEYPPLFEVFWEAYPLKVSKRTALASWSALDPSDALVAQMIRAIGMQKDTDQWRRGFIPHPTTWLNQHRWEDEVPRNNLLSPEGRETAANLKTWLDSFGHKE